MKLPYLATANSGLCPPVSLPDPIPLTTNHSSWILHIPNFIPPSSKDMFREYFLQHPQEYHPIFIFGKRTYENRYSQMYVTESDVASSYKYSGTAKKCLVCDPSKEDERFVVDLCRVADNLHQSLQQQPQVDSKQGGRGDNQKLKQQKLDFFNSKRKKGRNIRMSGNRNREAKGQEASELTSNSKMKTPSISTVVPDTLTEIDDGSTMESSLGNPPTPPPRWYNACLVNWYHPEHTIGLHADDEREMDEDFPIMSLSWGGPRRFLLRPKKHVTNYCQKVTEVLLQDGDWIVMGGLCQREFKHEVPKLRQRDGLVSDRISWTIRKMKTPLSSRTLPLPTARNENAGRTSAQEGQPANNAECKAKKITTAAHTRSEPKKPDNKRKYDTTT